MLAKQGWRLLVEANPLVSAVMKARYFPNKCFLEADMGSNPSYVWRGLMTAVESVKAGVRRQIGNGEDTFVWSVPWLPDINNGFITTGVHSNLQMAKVSNLFVPGERRWDIEVLEDLFEARDVELIQRVPLPLIEKKDSWTWLLDESGEFTVRSCYRWLQGEYQGEVSSIWKQIWKLNLPSKVAHFLWRVCRGCLPTNYALALRHVEVETTCPWCHSEVESDAHVLFRCGFARTVWLAVGLSESIQCSVNDTAVAVISNTFARVSKEQCVQVAMLCWGIWCRRNRWVWDRINGSAFGVKAAAMHLLTDWREEQLRVDAHVSAGEMGARSWTKPDSGWVKINTDAAVFQDGSIGIGAVIRNDQGEFVAAFCRRIRGAWHPREAEALALKEALVWSVQKGYQKCVFETDSHALALACNGKQGRGFFGTIVEDCLYLLKHINLVPVQFVYRSANMVAHVLAKASYSMSDLGEWSSTPPGVISHVLDMDLII